VRLRGFGSAAEATVALLILALLLSGAQIAWALSTRPEPPANEMDGREGKALSSSEERSFGLPPRERAVWDENDRPPDDPRLWLTVPEMERVENVPVVTAPASDNATLDEGALHVEATGFPWQEGSNAYIAGHRLGYAGTASYLLFYDLPELSEGDEVLLRDAEGEEYRYEVFRTLRVEPSQSEVMEPIPGRNVVSLQTCSLPDYAERIVVQAELVEEDERRDPPFGGRAYED
jgi:LPXTG-site transpeptidase (sortase) family protein